MPQPKSSKPAVTCGIFLYDRRSQKLLVCHATNASWKTWSIPKGLREEGEDPYFAAGRELQEETGIDLANIDIVKVHTLETVKYAKQNKLLEAFLVITDTGLQDRKLHCSTLVNGKFAEVDAWRWITPESAEKYLHESQLKSMAAIRSLLKS